MALDNIEGSSYNINLDGCLTHWYFTFPAWLACQNTCMPILKNLLSQSCFFIKSSKLLKVEGGSFKIILLLPITKDFQLDQAGISTTPQNYCCPTGLAHEVCNSTHTSNLSSSWSLACDVKIHKSGSTAPKEHSSGGVQSYFLLVENHPAVGNI